MRSIPLALVASLCASLLLTWLARGLARRYGALDRPDGTRKLHADPVPLWGGVAVYLAFALAGIAVRQVALIHYTPFHEMSWALILSAGLICLLGTIDDSWDLNGRLKLGLQVASMLPILLSGYFIHDIELLGTTIHLGYAGVPLTVLFLLGSINSLNLLDGMDGMAGLVGCVAAATIGLTAFLLGHHHVAMMATLLFGALVGFLCYNRPPATIYLGDSGSTTIGLLIGIVALEGFRTPSGAVPLAVSAAALTLPVVDTALAILRRVLNGRRFDAPDRNHIHHRLQEGGRSVAAALWIVALCATVAGVGALVARLSGTDMVAPAVSLGIVGWAAWRGWFARYEMVLLAHRIGIGAAWAAPPREPLPALAIHSQRSNEGFAEAWQELIRGTMPFPTESIELVVSDPQQRSQARHVWHRGSGSTGAHQWQLSLEFGASGDESLTLELRVSGTDAATAEPAYLAPLAMVLQSFGREWIKRVDEIPDTRLRCFDADDPSADDGYRHAA